MNLAKLAMAAAYAAAAVIGAFGQAGNWQIDSAHSTASLSLVSSRHTNRPFNIAVAMVAGELNLNQGAPTGPSLRLSIYPAGQDASLLNRDGSFRIGGLAALSRYTLATFQSRKALVTDQRKMEFTGDLTVAHVQRETAVAWSNAYAGAVSSEPVDEHHHSRSHFRCRCLEPRGDSGTGRKEARRHAHGRRLRATISKVCSPPSGIAIGP